MKPQPSHVAACVAAAAVLASVSSRHAAAQIDPQALQRLRAAARSAALATPAVIEKKVGASAAKADPTSRTVWLSALKVPGQQNEAEAGIRGSSFAPDLNVANAKVEATFVFAGATGGRVSPWLKVYEVGNATAIKWKFGPEVQGGSTTTFATDSFPLQAGKHYRAEAYVEVRADSSPNYVCAAQATITEINWIF